MRKYLRRPPFMGRRRRLWTACATDGRMRQSKPLRLSDLDAERTAEGVTLAVHARARRDARRLGMDFGLPAGVDPKTKAWAVLERSQVHKVARVCVAWALAGKGSPEDVVIALRELRADLEGVETGDASVREPDLSTSAGVVLVAAGARLALAEGRTVEAVEVATLASVDERSIRAAAAAGVLPPVGPGRPMRFGEEVVRRYLYGRGVPGFGAPSGPAVAEAPGAPAVARPPRRQGPTLHRDANPWEGVDVRDPLPPVEDAAHWNLRQIYGYGSHVQSLRPDD